MNTIFYSNLSELECEEGYIEGWDSNDFENSEKDYCSSDYEYTADSSVIREYDVNLKNEKICETYGVKLPCMEKSSQRKESISELKGFMGLRYKRAIVFFQQ